MTNQTYTLIPNQIIDALPILKATEIAFLMLIFRHGHEGAIADQKTKILDIKPHQWNEWTGFAPRSMASAVKDLEAKNLVLVMGKGQSRCYMFIPPAQPIPAEPCGKLVYGRPCILPLPHDRCEYEVPSVRLGRILAPMMDRDK